MGVAGVAWATFLCQSISCILSLVVVLRRLHKIETDEKHYIFSKSIFVQFIIIAIPSILQQSSYQSVISLSRKSSMDLEQA